MNNSQPTTYRPKADQPRAGNQQQKGFTLIEALVAVTILLVAIGGPLTLASQALSATRVAKEQMTATYLAMEAMEFVRNRRDENGLQSKSDWLARLGPCGTNNGCKIDVPQGVVSSCPAGGCQVLQRDADTGLYGYGGGADDTIYTREVLIQETVSGREADVTVTVSWRVGSRTRSVVVEDTLLRWID